MAQIAAIKSAEVGFTGKAQKAPKDKKEKPPVAKRVVAKVSGAVSNDFYKKYGDGVKVTPKLVADYTSDKLLGGAVVLASALVVFAKLRKGTSGLTRVLPEKLKNIDKLDGDGIRAKLSNFTSSVVKGIKENCIAYETTHRAEISPNADLLHKFKHVILRPVKSMDPESNLVAFIEKKAPKHAEAIKKGLAGVGIRDGHGLGDLAISGVLAAGLKKQTFKLVDGVATSDDAKLAKEAGIDVSKVPTAKIRLVNGSDALRTVNNVLDLVDKIENL